MHNENQPAKPSERNSTLRTLSARALTVLTVLTCGCTGPRPQHGGRAITTGGITQTLTQGDNPAQPSRQTQDTFRTRTFLFPPPILNSQPSTLNFQPPLNSQPPTLNSFAASTLSRSDAPKLIPVTDREEIHTTTELGAAQKDTARELGAKLSSLKGIVWVGLGLFTFGLASLFWPPLRAIIGSVTTSAAITLGGVGLMILPTLVVGHELLILGGIALAVGGWFLAHRHGHARGQLAALGTAPASGAGDPPQGARAPRAASR